MRELNFKYIKAENFLCFGPDGVEIDFKKYRKIVSVRAQNLDVNDKTSSNGAGKSSLPEIPVYAFYGRTIKKQPGKFNHTNVVNYQAGKKLYVEVQWDDYRIVRTRGPDSLRIWHSDKGEWNKKTELTRGGMPATQKYIEETVLGLSYETFVNIYIFSDDPTMSFLESDVPTKRQIVENLLSLDKYRGYFETAKTLVKQVKDNIQFITKDYERLLFEQDACKSRVGKIEEQEKEWETRRKQEITKYETSIQHKMKQLESSNNGAALVRYTEAQEQIKEFRSNIPNLESKRDRLNEIIKMGKPKYESTEKKIKELKPIYKKAFDETTNYQSIIEKNERILREVKEKIGGECPSCFGKIEEINFEKVTNQAKNTLISTKKQYEEAKNTWNTVCSEMNGLNTMFDKLEKGLTDAKKKLDIVNKEITGIHVSISELSKIKEPQVDIDERLIQEQIEELKKQLIAKKSEPSPFISIKDSVIKELVAKVKEAQDKKEEVKRAEVELPYYDFWVKAFGDKGIRKYIIDGIIPSLNGRIAYWLQFLIDNKIKLSFDNELKETIDRYPFKGRPYVYWGMSGGQRQRLNLTISQAWAYIMMLNCGCSPNIVWLDEVSKNIDESGIEGIYRMICELAKDKQVFVIDHNPHLLALLDGCDTINLVMENEITRKL